MVSEWLQFSPRRRFFGTMVCARSPSRPKSRTLASEQSLLPSSSPKRLGNPFSPKRFPFGSSNTNSLCVESNIGVCKTLGRPLNTLNCVQDDNNMQKKLYKLFKCYEQDGFVRSLNFKRMIEKCHLIGGDSQAGISKRDLSVVVKSHATEVDGCNVLSFEAFADALKEIGQAIGVVNAEGDRFATFLDIRVFPYTKGEMSVVGTPGLLADTPRTPPPASPKHTFDSPACSEKEPRRHILKGSQKVSRKSMPAPPPTDLQTFLDGTARASSARVQQDSLDANERTPLAASLTPARDNETSRPDLATEWEALTHRSATDDDSNMISSRIPDLFVYEDDMDEDDIQAAPSPFSSDAGDHEAEVPPVPEMDKISEIPAEYCDVASATDLVPATPSTEAAPVAPPYHSNAQESHPKFSTAPPHSDLSVPSTCPVAPVVDQTPVAPAADGVPIAPPCAAPRTKASNKLRRRSLDLLRQHSLLPAADATKDFENGTAPLVDASGANGVGGANSADGIGVGVRGEQCPSGLANASTTDMHRAVSKDSEVGVESKASESVAAAGKGAAAEEALELVAELTHEMDVLSQDLSILEAENYRLTTEKASLSSQCETLQNENAALSEQNTQLLEERAELRLCFTDLERRHSLTDEHTESRAALTDECESLRMRLKETEKHEEIVRNDVSIQCDTPPSDEASEHAAVFPPSATPTTSEAAVVGLEASNEVLQEEVRSLQASLMALQSEHTILQAANVRVASDNERMVATIQSLTSERNALETKAAAQETVLRELKEGNDSLRRERDEVCMTLESERSELAAMATKVTTQETMLRELKEGNESLRRERDEACVTLERERSELQAVATKAREEVELASREKADAAASALKTLEDERTRMAKLKAEAEASLEKQLEDLGAQLQATKTELESSRANYDVIKEANETLQAEECKLVETLKSLRTKNDSEAGGKEALLQDELRKNQTVVQLLVGTLSDVRASLKKTRNFVAQSEGESECGTTDAEDKGVDFVTEENSALSSDSDSCTTSFTFGEDAEERCNALGTAVKQLAMQIQQIVETTPLVHPEQAAVVSENFVHSPDHPSLNPTDAPTSAQSLSQLPFIREDRILVALSVPFVTLLVFLLGLLGSDLVQYSLNSSPHMLRPT